MNIIRIVYDWPDDNNITDGLAPAPYELSLAQARLGHKIFVLCGNLNGKNLKKWRFVYSLEKGRITVINLPRGIKWFGPFITTSIFIDFIYLFIKLSNKIDIIHNHGHLGVWFLIDKYVFRAFDKTPLVGHYHITAKGREEALKKQGSKLGLSQKYFEYPIHKFSDWLMANVSSHIVAVSKDLIAEIKKYYKVPDSKITLLESGVDLKRFNKKGLTLKEGFSKDSIVLGNGGRLSKRKNIHLIVEALKYLPEEFKLILWGKWDEEYKKQVDELIYKEKLEDRVKYLGSVNYFKTDEYYRAVDIFMLPSAYEGLPKVVLEALGTGCKVIASGFKTDKELANLYYAKKLDAKSLAKDIEATKKETDKYEETIEVLNKHYSWDSKAKILDEIYSKLVNISK